MELRPILYDDELKKAIALDKQAYASESFIGNFEKCKKWLSVCPDIYISLYDNKEMVGYINFLPLTPKCFTKYKNGEMTDSQIEISDISPYHKGENLCLFMSIVIDKKYQDGKAVILLTQALLDKINSYAKKGIYIKQMLAECVTDDGRRYITKTFNGKKITNGNNGEIYLCILDSPSSF